MSTTIDIIEIKGLVKKEDYSCHNCKFFTRAWIPRTGCDACRIPENTNKPTHYLNK